MRAVLITFSRSVTVDELWMPFTRFAHELASVPGLISKCWIVDESRPSIGGFYLFQTRAAADSYLEGPMWATVVNDASFSDFQVSHFAVIDGLTAITSGGPTRMDDHVRIG